MARKQLTTYHVEKPSVDTGGVSRAAILGVCLAAGFLLGNPASASAAEDTAAARFLGSASCSSSSCHGGGGTTQSEYTQWSKLDYHHERPFATLTTVRASIIAKNLQIPDATKDARCTACHAPLQTVPEALLAPENKVTEGVSCENCHAPAENWLRSHTRTDWTTADKVQAGVRNLKNLYVRANTCVACHQTVDAELRRAGHPELVFEMDGQLASEPRHWSREKDKPGPQIWLVGQAVALREISWQLAGEKEPETSVREQWEGLLHLMAQMAGVENKTLDVAAMISGAAPDNFKAAQEWSDQFAKDAANLTWTDEMTRRYLSSLTASRDTFNAAGISNMAQARYAERLVLALDRLTIGQASLKADTNVAPAINQLYDDVQDLPDFAPLKFVRDLNEFRARLPAGSP